MKKAGILLLCFLVIMLGGCWDKVEIDRNAFVSSIGVDVGKDIKEKKKEKEAKPDEPFSERDLEKLNVVYAFPDISKYSAQNTQIPSDKQVKAQAYSMEDAMAKAAAKSSRSLNLGHAQLLILSAELLQYEETVKQVIDYLSRNPMLNRTMYVMICEGDVEEFFNFKLGMENTLGAYIMGLMENSKRNASIIPVKLNEFLVLLSQNGNAIVPALKIDKEKNEMLLDGIAIIKEYKMTGLLSPQQTSTVEMLRGKLVSGKRVIYKDGIPIDYLIDGLQRKLKVSQSNGKLFFSADITIEGKIREYTLDKELFSLNSIHEIQNYFNSSLSEEGERMVKFVQSEYGVDIFGFREYVEKYMPDLWDVIRDNWESSFKQAVINVNVDTNIRRIGIKK